MKTRRMLSVLLVALVLATNVFALTLEGDPFFVTSDNVDPCYATYVIDAIEDVEAPIPGRAVRGHWNETSDSNFAFFFPKEGENFTWDHKFYHSVYPGTGGSNYDRSILQHAAAGAYNVSTAIPQAGGYRAVAAGAKLSREFAAEYYGYEGHIYGYVYGGSGGGSVTVGTIEGTEGVFDGAVPYVIPGKTAIPYNQCTRVFSRVLFKDAAPKIAEALEVGGDGDPLKYLTEEEAYFFNLLTSYGVPLKLWKNYGRFLEITPSNYIETEGTAAAGIPASGLMEMCRYSIKKDTTYWDEFWENPLYLGAGTTPEAKWFQSHEYTVDMKIQKVVADSMGRPASLRVDQVAVDPTGVGLRYELYTADGTLVGMIDGTINAKKKAFDVNFDYDDSVFPERGTAKKIWESIEEGMIVRASTRKNLAIISSFLYHLPADAEGHLEPNFYYLEQFLDEDGTVYDAWRDSKRAWMSVTTQGEQDQTGDIGSEKVIIVGCLADNEAYEIGCERYYRQFQSVLGDKVDDQVRLWWFDNADHMDSALSSNPQYYIAYSGGLMEALNQVSDWAQRGIAPTKTSEYTVENSQIVLAEGDANERGGIQPTIDTLTINGQDIEKVVIKAGETLTFDASFTLSDCVPCLSAVEWDVIGRGGYEKVEANDGKTSFSYTYNEPGIYLVAVRISSQSELLAGTSYGVAQNFRKVRVVVEPKLEEKLGEDSNSVTFYGNDPENDSIGQVWNEKHYYPVSWKSSEKEGTFTQDGGKYSAVIEGTDKAEIECRVLVWNGYSWTEGENEKFTVALPAAKPAPVVETPAPAPAPAPAASAPEAPAANGGVSPVVYVVVVAVVIAAAVCYILFRKKK